MKSVFILEDFSDVEKYLELKKKDLVLIATRPSACWYLEKNGLNYKPIENYYDSEELAKTGFENFKNVDNICEIIDDFSAAKISYISEYNLNPAKDNYSYIKQLYDALSFRIIILQKIIETEKPDEIFTFYKETNENNIITLADYETPFKNEDNIFSYIFSLKGWGCKTHTIPYKFEIRTNINKIDNKKTKLFRLNNKIKLYSLIYSAGFIFKKMGYSESIKLIYNYFIKCFINPDNLIILGYSYNWNNIIPELYKYGFTPLHINKELNFLADNDCDNELRFPYEKIKVECNISEIDFSKLFIEKLNELINISVNSAKDIILSTENIIEKYKPVAVLCSVKTHFFDNYFAKISKKHKIPVISWQHGAWGYFDGLILTYNELYNSTHHFTYGTGVINKIKSWNLETKIDVPELIPIGSYELQQKFLKKNDNCDKKYSAVYVTSNYYSNNLYIGAFPNILQDNELWNTQKNIIDNLGTIKGTFALKLHSAEYQNFQFYEYIEKRGFSNIDIINNEKSFNELLNNSKSIIIDVPSTVLLQALATKKTVFLCLNHMKIDIQAIGLLKKRIFLSNSVNEINSVIRNYFYGNSEFLTNIPDIRNTEFLELYGVNPTKLNCDEKAINYLNKIINSKK